MERRVDGVALIVLDALRFDFVAPDAQNQNQNQNTKLPQSVGSFLHTYYHSSTGTTRYIPNNNSSINSSAAAAHLYKFIADPPTVTMQRLLGLTTGGLPTFGDITGQFGGATVDEDSWLQQLVDVDPTLRGYSKEDAVRRKLAFVGDDTWVDLYPTQFDECHPYPSFNTRDLDTVDDGCFLHLPSFVQVRLFLYILL